MKSPVRTGLITLLLTLLVSGCGFHLRGQQPANGLEKIAIDGGSPYGELATEVRRQAESRKIEINKTADWHISLVDIEQSTWQASSTPSYSQNEYWLSLSVELHIRCKQREYKPVHLQRQLLFKNNSDELNSKEYEKKKIINDLQTQLAGEILQLVTQMAAGQTDCDCIDDES